MSNELTRHGAGPVGRCGPVPQDRPRAAPLSQPAWPGRAVRLVHDEADTSAAPAPELDAVLDLMWASIKVVTGC